MDSGTDTWVIVLAAFGGGLVGAILQPIMSYVMQRLLFKRENRARLERTIRRMLAAWIESGQKMLELATVLALPPVEPYEQRMAMIKSHRTDSDPGIMWQAERIPDLRLRGFAEEYFKVSHELGAAIFETSLRPQVIDRLVGEMHTLQAQVTRRMDELNYPEVDA